MIFNAINCSKCSTIVRVARCVTARSARSVMLFTRIINLYFINMKKHHYKNLIKIAKCKCRKSISIKKITT